MPRKVECHVVKSNKSKALIVRIGRTTIWIDPDEPYYCRWGNQPLTNDPYIFTQYKEGN